MSSYNHDFYSGRPLRCQSERLPFIWVFCGYSADHENHGCRMTRQIAKFGASLRTSSSTPHSLCERERKNTFRKWLSRKGESSDINHRDQIFTLRAFAPRSKRNGFQRITERFLRPSSAHAHCP